MIQSAWKFSKLLILTVGLSLAACSTEHKATVATAFPQSPIIQTIVYGDNVRVIIAADALFEFDSPQLKASAKPILNQAIATLRNYPDTAIKIAGFADGVMGSKQAQFLSQQQARSVLSYLWVQGFNAERLYAVGHGTKYPIAMSHTPASMAANRRIEISLNRACR